MIRATHALPPAHFDCRDFLSAPQIGMIKMPDDENSFDPNKKQVFWTQSRDALVVMMLFSYSRSRTVRIKHHTYTSAQLFPLWFSSRGSLFKTRPQKHRRMPSRDRQLSPIAMFCRSTYTIRR